MVEYSHYRNSSSSTDGSKEPTSYAPENMDRHGALIMRTATRETIQSSENTQDELKVDQNMASRDDIDVEDHERLAKITSNPDAMHRLEQLARTLSTHTTRDAPIEVDPEDFDLNFILRSFINDAQNSGIHLRSSGIRWRNLTAWGIDDAHSHATDVSDIFRSLINLPGKIKSLRHKSTRQIIRDFDGVLHEGEMCLVLGRPGSGCSTLLKTLAGEVDQLEKIEGDISYDGLNQDRMLKEFKGDVIYNPELDIHFPHLTVSQTLDFALACRTPNVRIDDISRKEFIRSTREVLATVFGLTHTYNTKVGNDFVRGVSGGERKRVSIAEALAARASIYCWDNATRGLDASTALEYTEAIRSSTNLLNNVGLVAIYQAGENIYQKFDKVAVLYDGRQVFFGPVTRAKMYFEEMGYACLPRQSTAEYLTAVTDPNGRFPREGMEDKVPRTADDFVSYWKNSRDYVHLMREINAYDEAHNGDKTYEKFKISTAQEKMKSQRTNSRYNLTYPVQLTLCCKRFMTRTINDRAYVITDCSASLIQSLVVGSLFYDIPKTTAGAFSRGGVLQFCLIFFCISSLANISNDFSQRPIVLKHRSYQFYHPSAEQLASIICDIPFKLISLVCFSIIIYFMTSLKLGAGVFFIYFLFLTCSSLVMTAYFKMISSISRTVAQANAIAGLVVLGVTNLTGYLVPQPQMHGWIVWISYLNPLFYLFEGLASNEFHGTKMACGGSLVPSGEGYESISSEYQVCPYVGSDGTTVDGDNYIKLQFDYSYSHVWRNFGITIAFWVFFVAVSALCAEYVRPVAGGGDKLMFKRGHLPSELQKSTKSSVDEETSKVGGSTISEYKEKVIGVEEMKEIFASSGLTGTDVFSWKNLDYVIPLAGTTRKLLDNVQGYVKPGTLTALMGESGAGKTTLLNTLSQRIHFGTITGDMLVNGKPIDASFERRTGYVQQQDIHIAELTVRESLQFSARLRQPASTPDSEKLDYVEKIIDLLGMRMYAEAVVGAAGVGLNVEQRKKLSIGVELVAKPSLLLFLDEPTSGLDSQSAWAIVQFLKQLAAAGQSILCTIHQPSATLFEQFDRLLLLKKGGKTVYFGDIGKNSQTMIDYFESHGAAKCGDDENPAEYILNCIGAGATASTASDWSEIWNNSEEFKVANDEVEEINSNSNVAGDVVDPTLSERFAASWVKQLQCVTWRASTQMWRDPVYIASKFVLLCSGGFFLGFTYYNVPHTISGNQQLLFAVIMCVVQSAALVNQIQERAIAARDLYEVRESASNTFHWSTMILGQLLAEIPYNFLAGVICYCCFYFPLKIDTSATIAGFFFLVFAINFVLYFTTFGLMVLYMSPDLPSAAVICGILLNFCISFCGVFQPVSLMPKFWTFMWKVSPYTYFIQCFVGTVLHDFDIECSSTELAYFNPPDGQTCGEYTSTFFDSNNGKINNPSATSNCAYCQYTVGDEYLSSVSIKFSQRWRDFGLLWVYIIFNIAAMLGLYWMFRVPKKNSYSPIAIAKRLFKKKTN